MSQENKEFEASQQESSSTLFSDPNSFYVDEKTPVKKNLLKSAAMALLAVVVVVGAAVAVKFLIPDNSANQSSSNSKVIIPVTEYASDDVESFLLTTKDYKTQLYSQIEESTDNTTAVKWYVDGVDGELTDSYSISTAVDGAVKMSAIRKMNGNEDDFGFANPTATVEIKSRNDKFAAYTITVGSIAPDRSGYYVKNSLKDEVYLVAKEDIEGFCKDIYAYANTTVVSALTDGDAPEGYISDGKLLKVDYINLYGEYFGSANMKFELNADQNTAPFMTYVMTLPYKRYADNDAVKYLIAPFVDGIYAERCHSYNATSAEIEKFGLDKPQIVLTLRVGNIEHTIKATRYDDGYFAVMVDNNPAIYQVTRSYLKLNDNYYPANYISKVVFTEMLKTFTDIDVTFDGKTYDFNVNVVESEDEGDVYNVTAGSVPIEAENFQNFYAQLLGMTVTEISLRMPDATTTMKVSLRRKDGTRTTIEFAKTEDRRYHVSVDGTPGGYISTTTYENLQNYAQLAYTGKTVPSVTQR